MSFGFSVSDFITAIELAKRIRKEFIYAPAQFKDISNEVRSLSIVFEDLEVLSARELSNKQKKELHEIAKGCRKVLEELEHTLGKYNELEPGLKGVGRSIKRVWKRLTWEPNDIRDLRSRIVAHVTLLNTFQGKLASQTSLAMKVAVDRLSERQDDQERREQRQTILEWLTPVDYAPQQSDYFNRRQEGTGRWLLESTEYQDWVITGNTLFCPGIPGAGKTILSSVVVEELTTHFQNDKSIGIAYLYFNFRRQEEQSTQDLLASLLKQLTQGQSFLADGVKSLYYNHRDRHTRPSVDEISKTLQSVAALYSRVFIVVDALDECQVFNGCRIKFLSEIFNLQAKCQARLFATSRFIPEIDEKFKGSTRLEIRASNQDVQRYLDGHMSQLPGCVLRSLELQNEIKAEIIKTVDGMFLLAQLHLDSLKGKRSPKAIRSSLKNLATGSEAYDYAYQEAMERIEGQLADEEELAKQVLFWVTCAKRPLTIYELEHALAVEPDELQFDEENLCRAEDMVSVCAGLVTIDEKSGIIRLVHYTTQEYFERTQGKWFPNAEADIMRTCITYLSFNTFNDDAFVILTKKTDGIHKLSSKYPLLPYAAQNWGYHAYRDFDLPIWSIWPTNVADVPMLQIAACFGLKETVKTLLEEGEEVEARSSDGWTALMAAAWVGQEAMIELLLDRGADIEARTENGWTALAHGSRNEHSGIVRKLLAKGADIKTRTDNGWTLLATAAFHQHESIICLLLENGADIESKTDKGWTPLLTAAYHQRESVIRLLLHKGANIEATNIYGWTSLDYVAKRGDNILTKLFLENGASFDTKSKYGSTPLMKAAESGDERTIQLLLQAGADKDTRDTHGETAYNKAVKSSKEASMRLLN